MTNTQIHASPELDSTRLRRSLPGIAVAVVAIAAAFTAWGAHGAGELWSMLALIALVTAGVYGVLLPRKLREPSAGGAALTCSLIGLAVLLPAFWSGLPLVLGVAGALLGYAGRNADRGSRLCVAAFVLGLLSALGYVAIYVLDALAQRGII
jgi:hypothetical protein